MIERIPFPAIGYESGINGTPIFGGTIAINELLHTLRSTVNSPSAPTFTTILINAYTLVDAAVSNGATDSLDTVKSVINQDMNILSTYFQAYCTQRGVKPTIVVYMPDYSLVSEYLRDLPPKKRHCLNTYVTLKNSIPIPENTVSFGEYAIIKCGERTLPHLIIPKVLKSHVSFSCTGILSHVSMDLHIREVIGRSSLYLAERYTGKIIQGTDFSKKIDKNGFVPFLKETHMTFGDTTLKPLVTGKAKASLLKAAEADNWKQRTSIDIAKRISLALTPDQRSELVKRISLI